MQPIVALFVWIIIVGLFAGFGARFRPGAWYEGLRKPSWTPPKTLFAPVWTVLYLAMAVAAWLVWRHSAEYGLFPPTVWFPLGLFLVQLFVNALWSWLFFGRHAIGAALADIVLLLLLICVTILAFRPHSPLAGWLMVPYLMWVCYATALNVAIWRRNR